jgi:hypothetical protein
MTCQRLKQLTDKQDRQKANLQRTIDESEADFRAKLAGLDEQIQAELANQRKARLAAEHQRELEQRLEDLRVHQLRSHSMATPSAASSAATTDPSPLSSDTPTAANSSPAPNPEPPSLSASQEEWDRMKEYEGQKNLHIDDIMKMVGLEKVKMQFLDVKEEIDLSGRQGIDVSTKNLNLALLGNPGTGERLESFISNPV